MKHALQDRLVDLGLNEYEAGVYLVLTEHAPASAAFVAKSLNLSRSTVYTALERLIAKGLIGTTYKNEVKQFAAEPASVIEDLLKRERADLDGKLALFSGLAGELKAMARADAQVPSVMFFEGQDSLRKIYLEMLRGAEKGATLRVLRDEFKWEKAWSFLTGKEWKDRVRKLRSERDIGARLLINDSPLERKQASYYRGRKRLEFRYLPPSAALEGFVAYILGDTVSLLSLEKNRPVGIRIVNRHLAGNFARMFDGLWQAARKPK